MRFLRTLQGLSVVVLMSAPSVVSAAPDDFDARGQPRFRNEAGPLRPASNEQWWTQFHDGQLNALMADAFDRNYDVAAAESRLDEAEALTTAALAPLLPTVSWDSSINTAPVDSLGFQFGGIGGMAAPGTPAPPDLYYTAKSSVIAAVELDLTGRNILARRAAKRDRDASESDIDAQRLQLASQVALSYYNLVAARAQRRAVQEQVDTSEDLLARTEARFDAGQTSSIEVLQQRQQLASTKKLIPQADAQIRIFEQQLAILTGEAPGGPFASAAELPPLPPRPGLGAPGDLQRSRPDLRAANERLTAARQRSKSGRRQFAPTLRLQAEGGVQAIRIYDWNSQAFWTAGAVVSVPLFNGGRTLAGLQQAKARERIAQHQRSASTLAAMRQVEDALVREDQQRETLELARTEAEAARRAFEESKKRYEGGVTDYLTVLSTLSAAQRAELGVITTHRDLIAARIELHTALGDR